MLWRDTQPRKRRGDVSSHISTILPSTAPPSSAAASAGLQHGCHRPEGEARGVAACCVPYSSDSCSTGSPSRAPLSWNAIDSRRAKHARKPESVVFHQTGSWCRWVVVSRDSGRAGRVGTLWRRGCSSRTGSHVRACPVWRRAGWHPCCSCGGRPTRTGTAARHDGSREGRLVKEWRSSSTTQPISILPAFVKPSACEWAVSRRTIQRDIARHIETTPPSPSHDGDGMGAAPHRVNTTSTTSRTAVGHQPTHITSSSAAGPSRPSAMAESNPHRRPQRV